MWGVFYIMHRTKKCKSFLCWNGSWHPLHIRNDQALQLELWPFKSKPEPVLPACKLNTSEHQIIFVLHIAEARAELAVVQHYSIIIFMFRYQQLACIDCCCHCCLKWCALLSPAVRANEGWQTAGSNISKPGRSNSRMRISIALT